jgi:hypothetical protein
MQSARVGNNVDPLLLNDPGAPSCGDAERRCQWRQMSAGWIEAAAIVQIYLVWASDAVHTL